MKAGYPTDKWKRSLDDYLDSAKTLFASMKQHGFMGDYPIPVDPDGEILDGSHRIGCALALGIDEVPIERHARYVWAAPWNEDWFRQNGLPESDIERLKSHYDGLSDTRHS